MRCSQCNVDLAESSRVCPLCGAPAETTDAVLAALKEAPYPDYQNAELAPLPRRKPNMHFLRIVLIVSAFCALLGSRPLWTTVAPVLLIAVSVFYFCSAFKEKSVLLHSAVALLVNLICQLLFFVFALIQNFRISGILFSMLVCVILIVILYFKRSEQMDDQFDATFHL